MYKSNEKQIMIPDDFFLPFGGKLDKENRWVKYNVPRVLDTELKK